MFEMYSKFPKEMVATCFLTICFPREIPSTTIRRTQGFLYKQEAFEGKTNKS